MRRSTGKHLTQLKKDYINAYIAQHSKARLGVAEDKTNPPCVKIPALSLCVLWPIFR